MHHKCIDITKVNSFPEYDMIYCDPPWEQRMVRFFETQMKKQTGEVVENQIDEILTSLGRLSSTDKPLFIEYSVKGSDRVIEIMKRYGHKHRQYVECTYSRNLTYAIMSFNTNAIMYDGKKETQTLDLLIDQIKPNVVFDPFAGIGVLAKAVNKKGVKYIGYEVNRARFERMIKIAK